MSSSGQRFRRRAIRRGYKVDEVDEFLDRVEATLNGAPIGAPVKAHDVHDVVFRVRFGGYDEWQVDLHLDRVERQLAEAEDRPAGRPDMRPPLGGAPDRMGPPPPLPSRAAAPPPAGVPAGPPGPRYDQPRFDETYAGQGAPAGFDGFDPGRQGRDMPTEVRLDRRPEPPRGEPYGAPAGFGPPAPPPRVEPPRPDYPPRGFDDDATGTFGAVPPAPAAPPPGYGGPPAPPQPQPGFGAPAGGAPSGDVQRVDQLRRTFQLRRFGSGYDPAQVDRIFENVLGALSNRGPGGVNEADLDATRLNLVPGGYYEAEVEQALREVRDIIRR